MNWLRAVPFIVVAIAAGIAGWTAKGWTVETSVVVEKPHDQVRHSAGDVTASNNPGQQATLPAPKLDAGQKIVQTIQVQVRPRPAAPSNPVAQTSAGDAAQAKGACQPVDLRLDLLRNQDGTEDARVTSPNGDVLAAARFPVASTFQPTPRPWLVAGAYEPGGNAVGIVAGRDVVKRIFVGGMLMIADNKAYPAVVVGGRF